MVSGKESGFGEGLGYSLIPESRILIPDSLLGKRGSVRVGSAQLFSLKRCGGRVKDQPHKPLSFAGSPASEHVVRLAYDETAPSPSCALCLRIPATPRC